MKVGECTKVQDGAGRVPVEQAGADWRPGEGLDDLSSKQINEAKVWQESLHDLHSRGMVLRARSMKMWTIFPTCHFDTPDSTTKAQWQCG